jgi:hypothetical protein
VGNTDQRGVFVLPVVTAGAWQSSATSTPCGHSTHEGRRWLQFSAMIERGVSLARALYGFNSVNVEG